jgi:predicted esterase YcpF (UPF0227 family)
VTADSAERAPGRPAGRGARASHVLYLHGFRSSPQSFKAQRLAAWLRAHRPEVLWWCPQLPPSPQAAVDLVLGGIATWPQDGMAVVGSSLGGFYATVVAERTGCRAVLLNPAVNPARDLAGHLGEQTGFHDPTLRFTFGREHIEELRTLAPATITQPDRYFAIIAKGDEVLDWREMHARYAGCPMRLLEGGDHGLSEFDEHLPAIVDFLGMDS